MKTTTITRALAALALATTLALGQVPPSAADPGDFYRPQNVLSKQYRLDACRYKVAWGNYGPTAYTNVHIYNDPGCVGTLVGIGYYVGLTLHWVFTGTITASGSDACGSYNVIQAASPVAGTAVRAAVNPNGGATAAFYALDGTATQQVHNPLC